MNKDGKIPFEFSSNHPSAWEKEQFKANWFNFLEKIVGECSSLIPSRRILRQVEQTAAFQEVLSGWDAMDGSQRLESWKKLLACAEEASQQMLPACIQCGECCRRGSPTLHLEDLELLRTGRIGWEHLLTLRKGEPARSPFDGNPFVLPEERIKLREKKGLHECVFLDSETDQCTIYNDRPLQCRAQACWDPIPAKDLAELPFLLRQHLFAGVDVLLDVIAEHESRCGFEALADAFEQLHETSGKNVREVLGMLSYEDHFRNFVSEKFTIPPENLELLLGRSFVELTPLFGYRVTTEPDGSRCLIADIEGDRNV